MLDDTEVDPSRRTVWRLVKLGSGCCQAACLQPGCPVCVVWRASSQHGMWAPGIIVANPPGQTGAQLGAGLKCVQIDALILQAAPETLDEYVVHPSPTAIHRDACAGFLQHSGEAR